MRYQVFMLPIIDVYGHFFAIDSPLFVIIFQKYYNDNTKTQINNRCLQQPADKNKHTHCILVFSNIYTCFVDFKSCIDVFTLRILRDQSFYSDHNYDKYPTKQTVSNFYVKFTNVSVLKSKFSANHFEVILFDFQSLYKMKLSIRNQTMEIYNLKETFKTGTSGS